MRPLLLSTSFPHLHNDMTIAQAQLAATGALPPSTGLASDIVLDMNMTYAMYLLNDNRTVQASQLIDNLVYDDDGEDDKPPLYSAWLWLARMTVFIADGQHSLALGCAENALQFLASIHGKKSEDFMALLVSILYNLASIHHATGDNSRAAKELTKAQKILERLAKRNEARFSAMLLYAVEASTDIIQSRVKQMNVFTHYQKASELYTNQLLSGDENETRNAMNMLIDTLKKEGDIMLEMGNSRNAVKYYTKALRYQKKLNESLGYRDLVLSIGLAKALMRLVNRRASAEQLLTSLLPLAKRLEASNEVIEIENLLLGKNKNSNIMILLKGIF